MALDTQGARDKRLGRMLRKLAEECEGEDGITKVEVRRNGSRYGVMTPGNIAIGRSLEEAVSGAVDHLTGAYERARAAALQAAEERSVERELRIREATQ